MFLAIQIIFTDVICGLNLKLFSIIFSIGMHTNFADSQWLILTFLKCNKNLNQIQIQFSGNSLHWQPIRFSKYKFFLHKKNLARSTGNPLTNIPNDTRLKHHCWDITSVNKEDKVLSYSGEYSAREKLLPVWTKSL